MTELYKGVCFKNQFRDYQARVLEQMRQMLDDGRLHVSAAPGAGKTVLGLETIRRLGNRALILVPTINLRNQWKERFLNQFVGDNELKSYWSQNFSTDIRTPGIITCTTYQALYSIYSENDKKTDKLNSEVSSKNSIEYKGLIELYKNMGVTTICLDEAHHLKREWWKALTDFISHMNATLIALTATPPMDTSDLEWRRYISLCGEIDLEISIPEMVVKQCLCPHQDYLYVCKASELEEKKVEAELQRNRESEALVLRNKQLYEEIKNLPYLRNPKANRDLILKNPEYIDRIIKYAAYIKNTIQVELEGSMALAEKAYIAWDKNIQKMVYEECEKGDTKATDWLLPLMKDILENVPSGYSDALRSELTEILTNNHLMKDGKVQLRFNSDGIDKVLKNSATKLNAIVEILKSESAAMGTNLRALVLMDHIRKEDISKIETDESLTDLGVSTVFERLRRQEHLGNLEAYFAIETEDNRAADRVYRSRIGVLTGSLVILPDAVAESLIAETGLSIRIKKLGITGYSTFESGSDVSDQIVSKITEYFCQGRIEILIGTAALLGEGWDAPAVNTLILGSTSSSYVKTNQMRGRALRIEASNPYKVSNIWHLISMSDQVRDTAEQKSMVQRFGTIVGISMDGRRVENGMARLSDGLHSIERAEEWNQWMLQRANDREFIYNSWGKVPAVFRSFEVRNVVTPRNIEKPKGIFASKKVLSPKQQQLIASGTLAAMKYTGMASQKCVLSISHMGDRQSFYIENASERESSFYAQCLSEAFSSIVAPKYIVSYGFFFKQYVPVPKAFSTNDSLANQYRQFLKASSFLIKTETDQGKEKLLKIRLSPEYQNITEEGVRIVRELI
jgi:superfamily II DNA or RNA helicase